MNQLDVYYRALLDYRAQTQTNRECAAQRNAIAKVNTDSDSIVLTRMVCTVDEDWVNAIEKGLVHVEKAIKEERQFIRSNGEVIPIEKVKQVSKDSVEHLARHSNLVTRFTEGEDIIPDQLYTVERLSDFAVYENRFLYMLLCYLRDFITLRYNKILQASNTYDGKMTMSKTVKMNKQTIKYDVRLEEERRDDAYLKEHNEAKQIIDRIDLLLKTVLAFLATPLMEYASKAPMLKPPITKTNVLKMNNNFKGAMALYEYVTAYTKPGYTIETKINEMSPFREMVADEMMETVLLSSFLTYEYSLDLRDELRKSYEEEEQRRKELEYQKFLEKLEKVKRRVQKSGQTPEEYILMLEKQVRILENKCVQLDAALAEIERLKAALEEANERIASLTEELERTYEELEYQKRKYIEDMAALKAEYEERIRILNEEHAEEIRQLNEAMEAMRIAHAEEIRALNEAHAEEIRALKEFYDNEIVALKQAHAEEIESIRLTHENEIEELKVAHAEEIERLNSEHIAEIAALNAEHNAERDRLLGAIDENKKELEEEKTRHAVELAEVFSTHRAEMAAIDEKNKAVVGTLKAEAADKDERIRQLLEKNAELEEKNKLLTASVYALKTEKGEKITDVDFTSKENFEELERIFELFKKFYYSEWKKTKKSIRHSILKNKNNGEGDGGAGGGSDANA